jgi:D-sedoheptulose 7-phosphate isomerase
VTPPPAGPQIADDAYASAYVSAHVSTLIAALERFRGSAATAAVWGKRLADLFSRGGRLLAAGNGGSAAQAQHLTAELVGRYRHDREPFSAIALHAETSAATAIANDYGWEQVFARQVRAHGRPGDVLVLLSTSGRSSNVLAAARAGRSAGLRIWSMTGPAPNPLAQASHELIAVDAGATATVQEVHLVALHMVCAALDRALGVAADVPPGVASSMNGHLAAGATVGPTVRVGARG